VLTFLSYIGLYREQASWQSTKEIDEIYRTIHIVTVNVSLQVNRPDSTLATPDS